MISTKGRYAVRVMIDLASNDQGHFIPLKDIAARQEISKKYLEIIMKDMVAGGLVTGASGKGGGYKLSRRPEDYRLDEILEIMEGPLAPVACLSGGTVNCDRSIDCPTLPVWQGLDKVINEYLDGITLQDVVDQQRARYADNYVI